MKTNTCGECRYYAMNDFDLGECHANPPVIVDAIIKEILKRHEGEDFHYPEIVPPASNYPHVYELDRACRFFVEGGE